MRFLSELRAPKICTLGITQREKIHWKVKYLKQRTSSSSPSSSPSSSISSSGSPVCQEGDLQRESQRRRQRGWPAMWQRVGTLWNPHPPPSWQGGLTYTFKAPWFLDICIGGRVVKCSGYKESPSWTWRTSNPSPSISLQDSEVKHVGLTPGFTWQPGQPAESDRGQRESGRSLEELTIPT